MCFFQFATTWLLAHLKTTSTIQREKTIGITSLLPTMRASNTYTWKNTAGATWTLSSTINSNQLRVHKDSPYFKTGHKISTFNQMGIYGPGNEFYTKTCSLCFVSWYIEIVDTWRYNVVVFCVKTLKWYRNNVVLPSLCPLRLLLQVFWCLKSTFNFILFSTFFQK